MENASAVECASGQVLLAYRNPYAIFEILDLLTGTSEDLPIPSYHRDVTIYGKYQGWNHSRYFDADRTECSFRAWTLEDGRVLFYGKDLFEFGKSEHWYDIFCIYDPRARAWSTEGDPERLLAEVRKARESYDGPGRSVLAKRQAGEKVRLAGRGPDQTSLVERARGRAETVIEHWSPSGSVLLTTEPLDPPRGSVAALVLGSGELAVLGGRLANGAGTSLVQAFDARTRTWASLPLPQAGGDPIAPGHRPVSEEGV
ncbi:MAG: hypothetical protein HY319_07075 [Armatimonadetes bacterium]|nr:hypothetical protein [Armatimonadota bacterium]